MLEALFRTIESTQRGFVNFDRAAVLLDIPARKLMRKMVAGEVLYLDYKDEYFFPAFQFYNGGLRPGLASLLRSAKAPMSEIVAFFTVKFYNDQSIIDLLCAGITEMELAHVTDTMAAYFNGDLAP